MINKKIILILSVSLITLLGSSFALWYVIRSLESGIEIELSLTNAVSRRIGDSEYTFKLYPYDSGIYLLRIEKDNDLKTKVIVQDHTYIFFDLQVHVVRLTGIDVILKVRKI